MKEKDIISKDLARELKFHGITRRDFLKYCAATAAVLGLSEFEFTTKLARALEKTTSGKPPVIWIEGQACAGCTISFAQSLFPPVASIILDKISVRYDHTIMAATGHVAEMAYEERYGLDGVVTK